MVPSRYNIIAACTFLLLSSNYLIGQQIDTLRQYDPKSPLVFYGNPSVRAIAARFETSGPESITRVIVALGGTDSTATALLHIYGDEGGASAPFLAVDLIPPVRITKTRPGVEQIDVVFESSLKLQSHQFYVVLDNMSSGLRVMSDSRPHKVVCASDRERFTSQLVKYSDGRWRSGRYAFRVDVVTERPSRQATPMFVDVTNEAFAPDSQIADGFISWGDYDNDNWLDLIVGPRLFHNTRDGHFQDVTIATGLSLIPSKRCFIDANSDGRVDILSFGISDSGATENVLFVQAADGKFSRQELRLPRFDGISSISLADFDQDGFTDAYVGCYSPDSAYSSGGYLLRNTGHNEFVDESVRLGTSVRTLGSQWADVDGTGALSLFVARPDSGPSYWKNRGDGTFDPIDMVSRQVGRQTITTRGAYGCQWIDLDADGDLDLLQPQMIPISERRTKNVDMLWSKDGAQHYANREGEGIVYNEMHAGGTWGDIDNDGRIDLVLTTACDCRYMDIYRLHDDGRFVQETQNLGMQGFAVGPDATLLDYNNDGRLDIATRHNGRFVLLGNQSKSTNNFVAFNLGTGSAAGTTITVFAGNKRLVGYAASGRGYLVQDPPRLQFGLGNIEHVDSIEVRQPTGSRYVLTDFAVNTIHRLDNRRTASNEEVVESATIHAYPNPFHDVLNFEITIPTAQRVTLRLYTATGTLVATLIDDDRMAGKYAASWTPGTRDVAQGTYIYRLSGSRFPDQQGRIVLVR